MREGFNEKLSGVTFTAHKKQKKKWFCSLTLSSHCRNFDYKVVFGHVVMTSAINAACQTFAPQF